MSARDLIESPQDFIVLQQQQSPGIATISGGALVRRLNERRAFGVAGATVVDQGAQLCSFTVTLKFSTPDDLAAWDTWKELLALPATRTTRGQDIQHPILDDLGIRAVLLESRGQLEQDEMGSWSVELKFREYRRPIVALAVPDGAAATTTDPIDLQIEALSTQVQALAGPLP